MHGHILASAGILLALAGLEGCDSAGPGGTGPSPEPPAEFGTVRVLVDGKTWVRFASPGAFVGFYDPRIAQLEVRGVYYGPLPDPGYGLNIRLCAVPEPRSYRFADHTLAMRATWGAPGALRPRQRHGYLDFFSANTTADTLVLEEFDLANARIRGRFTIHAVSTSGRITSLLGRFDGRVTGAFLGGCP
jgi:hypothetical protein